MTTAIAVDPGAHGVMVAMTDKEILEISDIPHRSFGKKMIVDVTEVRKFIDKHSPDFVIIETVWTSPTDGRSSGASLVRSWGCLYGATAGYDVRFVLPSKWKSYSGLIGMVKAASVPRALRFFPSSGSMIEGHKNAIDRADAILIGRYGLFESQFQERK